MLQFNPTALISPFAKKNKKNKNKKNHIHIWIFSKMSATMETENHLGKKMLQCVYEYFSHSTVSNSRDFGKASSHDLRAIQYILWDNQCSQFLFTANPKEGEEVCNFTGSTWYLWIVRP